MEAGAPPPEPQVKTPQEAAASADPAEKLEGVHAWVAQLDRKLQTRFYALAAAAVLALAAGIVAVVLALGVQDDSATKAELQELRDQVDNATRTASDAAQDEVAELDERVAEIESQLESLRADQGATTREISVLQDDIADLREQIDVVEQAQEDAAATEDTGTGDTDEDGP
jgi:septal ring factor EnvC (AmiA/AmiB activator)